MLYPAAFVVLPIGRALTVTKAEHIRCDHPALFGKLRDSQTPVCPGGDAGAGAMDKHDRKPLAHIVKIGLPAGGLNSLA